MPIGTTFPTRRTPSRPRFHGRLRPSGLAARQQSAPPCKQEKEPPTPPSKLREMEPEAEAFAAGDPEAIAVLFERHRDGLFRMACRFLADGSELGFHFDMNEAEDMVQDLMVNTWKRRHLKGHYRPEIPVFAWLVACMRRVHLQRIRWRKQRKRGGGEMTLSLATLRSVDHHSFSHFDRQLAEIENAESREKLQYRLSDAIERLPVQHRHVVNCRLSGMSFVEVGAEIGRSGVRAGQLAKESIRALSEELSDIHHSEVEAFTPDVPAHPRDVDYTRHKKQRRKERALMN